MMNGQRWRRRSVVVKEGVKYSIPMLKVYIYNVGKVKDEKFLECNLNSKNELPDKQTKLRGKAYELMHCEEVVKGGKWHNDKLTKRTKKKDTKYATTTR
jgi:hypothetical protein